MTFDDAVGYIEAQIEVLRFQGHFDIASNIEESLAVLTAGNCAGRSIAGNDAPAATRRDQFAMAALTGILSHPTAQGVDSNERATEYAYEVADAMEKARIQEMEKKV